MTENPTPEMPKLVNDQVAELIAMAAAVAANAEQAFQASHYRACKLEISKPDMIKAVNIGLSVKAAPHQNIMDMAQAFLVGPGPKEGGCCGGDCACESDGEGCCDEEGAGCCGGDSGGCGCH